MQLQGCFSMGHQRTIYQDYFRYFIVTFWTVFKAHKPLENLQLSTAWGGTASYSWEYRLQFLQQGLQEGTRPTQGNILQQTKLLYMEKFKFLHSGNRFYKTDTKSRIPPLHSDYMSEVENDMESWDGANFFPLNITWQGKEHYAAQWNRTE